MHCRTPLSPLRKNTHLMKTSPVTPVVPVDTFDDREYREYKEYMQMDSDGYSDGYSDEDSDEDEDGGERSQRPLIRWRCRFGLNCREEGGVGWGKLYLGSDDVTHMGVGNIEGSGNGSGSGNGGIDQTYQSCCYPSHIVMPMGLSEREYLSRNRALWTALQCHDICRTICSFL